MGISPGAAQTPPTAPPSLLLPAEQAWLVTLAARPAAGGAMDGERVYIPVGPRAVDAVPQPGTEQIVALDRQTGERRWTRDLQSSWPPVVVAHDLFVAAADGIHALDAATGASRFHRPLTSPVLLAPAIGDGLLVVATADALLALRAEDGMPAWELPLDPERPPRAMVVDGETIYVSLEGARLARVSLRGGDLIWERTLAGVLGAPAVARDRVVVGSTDNHLYALESDDGSFEWRYPVGNDVVGAVAVDEKIVFVALDNVVRALDRESGNQRWKSVLGTRPSAPPRLFGGAVFVSGFAPALAVFEAATGAPLAMYTAPSDLVAPALVDPELKPFRVAIVAITGDGRVAGLTPSRMAFREPAPVPLPALPGRALEREPAPSVPE